MLGKMSLKNNLQIFIFTFSSIYQSKRSIVYLLFFAFNLQFVILLLLIKTLKLLIYSICFVSSTFWPFSFFSHFDRIHAKDRNLICLMDTHFGDESNFFEKRPQKGHKMQFFCFISLRQDRDYQSFLEKKNDMPIIVNTLNQIDIHYVFF